MVLGRRRFIVTSGVLMSSMAGCSALLGEEGLPLEVIDRYREGPVVVAIIVASSIDNDPVLYDDTVRLGREEKKSFPDAIPYPDSSISAIGRAWTNYGTSATAEFEIPDFNKLEVTVESDRSVSWTVHADEDYYHG